MKWIRIRELVRKEFIQLFRDKKNRPLLIIAPLVQLTVFGYVVTTDVKSIRVGLFDQAHTLESRMFKDAIGANRTFKIIQFSNHADDLEQTLLKRKGGNHEIHDNFYYSTGGHGGFGYRKCMGKRLADVQP